MSSLTFERLASASAIEGNVVDQNYLCHPVHVWILTVVIHYVDVKGNLNSNCAIAVISYQPHRLANIGVTEAFQPNYEPVNPLGEQD